MGSYIICKLCWSTTLLILRRFRRTLFLQSKRYEWWQDAPHRSFLWYNTCEIPNTERSLYLITWILWKQFQVPHLEHSWEQDSEFSGKFWSPPCCCSSSDPRFWTDGGLFRSYFVLQTRKNPSLNPGLKTKWRYRIL